MQESNGPSKRAIRRLQLPLGVTRANTVYLFIIALVAGGAVLRLTGGIFIPLVIALLLSFAFSPVVNFLSRYHVPRIVSILLVLLVFVAFGVLIGMIVYSSFQSLLQEFPTYQARFSRLLRDLIERFDLPADIIGRLEITRTVGNALLSFSGGFVSFGSGFMLVLLFLLFLLLEMPYMRSKTTLAFRGETTRRLSRVFLHVTSQVGRYVAVKLFVSILTALVVYISFSIIGVDFPFIWAVLTFLFNFIPSIGSIVITFISAIFAFVQFFPDWNPIIATIISMGTAQFFIGNVIDPKLLGDRLNLSPVVILISLLFWGWLWDVAGLFLAVPLTVMIKIVLDNTPGMEAFGILMGTGALPVTPRRGENNGKRRRDNEQRPPTEETNPNG